MVRNEIRLLECIPKLSYDECHDFDSGCYSDLSEQSSPTSPCSSSPPLSPLLISELPNALLNVEKPINPFNYFYCSPYSILSYSSSYCCYFPIYPLNDFDFAPEPIVQEVDVQEVEKTPQIHKRSTVNRLIKWSLPPPTVPYFPLPGWDPMPYGMEQFWQSAFAWFFLPFCINNDHLWTLQPISSPPAVANEWPWHTISYSAKVRFQCPYKHGWTSMKGRVVFWYRMRRDNDVLVSEAYFKLYGQQCNRCHKNPGFLSALWYHEEIENAVRFLATEVAKTYYGGEDLPHPRRLRQGNPSKDTHHDPSRCQACQEGLCVKTRI